jgi:cell wall-associated NlpC family hydrolase
MRTEDEERAAVEAAAMVWDGTPFHHHANVLGHGIDCAHLILEAHIGAGLVNRFETEQYPADWMFHRDEERFVAKIEEYATLVGDSEAPLRERGPDFFVKKGNVLIWRYGRTFSHSAIVSDWPMIIHASHPARICLRESVYGQERTEKNPLRVYSYWGS